MQNSPSGLAAIKDIKTAELCKLEYDLITHTGTPAEHSLKKLLLQKVTDFNNFINNQNQQK